MPKSTPTIGARVAYSASHLKNTGQYTGSASMRRGTFLGLYPGLEKSHGRVRWDDEAEYIAAGVGQYAEADYCAEVVANGSLVALCAIAVVNSARFALNDL